MKRNAGYSLVEVLIAFVIMTLVLGALIPGQARLLSRAATQEEKLLAHDYALSRQAIAGVATPLAVGITNDAYRSWSVTTTVTPAADAHGDILSLRIEISDQHLRLLAEVETLRVAR